MKPLILQKRLELGFDKILDRIKESQVERGGLDMINCDQVLDFSGLIKCAEDHGYYRPKYFHTAPPHVVITNGSVKCHTDPDDYGVTVGCLLRDDKSDNFSAELVTQHGALELEVGDVFVFDSCLWHGWIADGLCLLAMISVCAKEEDNY